MQGLELEMIIDEKFFKECCDITSAYEQKCGRWALDSQLLHIVSEIAELKDVLRNKDNKYGTYGTVEFLDKVGDELADVFLKYFALVSYLGMSNLELNKFLLRKIAEVRQRVDQIK